MIFERVYLKETVFILKMQFLKKNFLNNIEVIIYTIYSVLGIRRIWENICIVIYKYHDILYNEFELLQMWDP